MLAMVGLVAVVLVIAGVGSLLLTRNAARNQAQQQLVTEANSLTSSKIGSESLKVLSVVRKTLKLEDADVIQIDRLGNVVTPLPWADISRTSTWPPCSRARRPRAARATLVYAVAPVTLSAQELRQLAGAPRTSRSRARSPSSSPVTSATSGRAGATSSSPGEPHCSSPRWWPGR